MSQWAVNGKVPISVWCPSRDDSGNGTTTLNDLVGTNHATLTSMNPATDWVADTDAGGIRALDFNVVNALVNCGSGTASTIISGSRISVSAWAFRRTTGFGTGFGRIFEFGNSNSHIIGQNTAHQMGSATIYLSSSGPLSVGGVWTHVVFVAELGTQLEMYRNGVALATSSKVLGSGTFAFGFANCILGNRQDASRTFDGRLDDIRIFNVALDSSDVSYLYNSGAGRGRLASSRRRNNIFVGALF